ncbi:MAG: T9SS type A sorting domain-containing protein, partial [Paludibacter sp.]|nr:T9SS type A sorting domain-containing protein [Paludibacter sp.]
KAAADASAKIISLRKMYPTAFTAGTFSLQIGLNYWSAGRRIALTHADLNLIVLGNFTSSTTVSANPNFPKTGSWYNLLTGEIFYVGYTTTPINLKAGEVLILTDRPVNFLSSVVPIKENNNFKVYPSTTQGKVFISTPTSLNSVNVYNLQGTKVMSGINKAEIDMSHLTNGMYLVEVIYNETRSTNKISKQ